MREYLTAHSIQAGVGLLFGALGMLVGLYVPDDSPFPPYLVSLFCFLLFFQLSYIASELVVMVSQREIFQRVERSLELLIRERSLLPGASKPVHDVLLRFSKRFWGDIATEERDVLVLDYVSILEESLVVATKTVFATSLINPTTWLSDQDYTKYLDRQIERKHQMRQMVMQRVFILEPNSFYGDEKSEDLVKKHLDAGIEIGFCDSRSLAKGGIRDLVIFETNGEKWVVEAGKLPANIKSSDKETPVPLRFHFAEYSIQQLFQHWKQDVDTYTTFFKNFDDFSSKKSAQTRDTEL